MKKITFSERMFKVANCALMVTLAFIALFPFLHIISKALSSASKVRAGLITIYPQGFHLDAIKYVMRDAQFLISARVSIISTVTGTLFAILVTTLTAYPLSKPKLRGRKPILYLFVFTMLFSGGIVPSYLLIRSLQLVNTLWVLILTGMFSTYNMLIMKSFFEALPESIEESAKIDGAGSIRILFFIVLPMSTASIATIGLFYAVGYWNSYFSSILYITKQSLKPLQHYLYDIVRSSMNVTDGLGGIENLDEFMNIVPDSVRAATIFVSTAPILLLYPFLQKYFVKGLTIGSVKG